jgi:hypothetical protein
LIANERLTSCRFETEVSAGGVAGGRFFERERVTTESPLEDLTRLVPGFLTCFATLTDSDRSAKR